MTISPTHVPGMKEYAWKKFLAGSYIAIGWINQDLTGKTLEEIISIIREKKYDNESSAIDSFTKFLKLEVGDYVAVNNTNAGLFGIGVIKSGYKYQKDKHDVGDPEEPFYSHFREVEWKYTNYVRRKDIVGSGETGWKPFGTVGSVEFEVPPYILRLLGEMPAPSGKKEAYVPEFLKKLIETIFRLRKDTRHQERAHESLVEDFFVELGYKKHEDIKYRQGRIDLSLWQGEKLQVIVEVKRDWNLSLYNNPGAVQQAYGYALDNGARWVILTNGDYYAIFDRLKGLSISNNLIGEFRLTSLEEEDEAIIQRLVRENLVNPNLEEIFRNLSENFK